MILCIVRMDCMCSCVCPMAALGFVNRRSNSDTKKISCSLLQYFRSVLLRTVVLNFFGPWTIFEKISDGPLCCADTSWRVLDLGLREPEAKLKRGVRWRHYVQSTVIRPFDRAQEGVMPTTVLCTSLCRISVMVRGWG